MIPGRGNPTVQLYANHAGLVFSRLAFALLPSETRSQLCGFRGFQLPKPVLL